ncbi:hypothetical protein ACWGB8_12425 [Kitasatospora sp. NPDC054939]
MNRRTTTLRIGAAVALCLAVAAVAVQPASAVAVTPSAPEPRAAHTVQTAQPAHDDNDTPADRTAAPTRVRGSFGVVLNDDFPAFKGDPVRFEVDARTGVNGSPEHARGRMHVTHLRPDGRLVADLEIKVGCVVAAGRDAIVTGVVTAGEAPWFPDMTVVGSRVAVTVQDNGRVDRVGWVMGAFGAPVADCQGTVPFIRTSSGTLTVHG